MSSVAKWTCNVSINTVNLKINGKHPNGSDIFFRNSGKYIYSVTKLGPFLYKLLLEIRDIVINDEGQYSLQVKSDNGSGQSIILHLTVQGSIVLSLYIKYFIFIL